MSKKIKIIVLIIIVLVVFGTLYFHYTAGPDPKELATIEQGTMMQSFTETAALKSRQQAAIYTTATETVSTVHVQIGDKVSAGDVLLTYKGTHDLQLDQLQAQRQAVNAQTQAQISAAQSALQNATLLLEEATKKHQQNQQLFEADAISRQVFDESAAALKQQQNQHAAASATYDAAVVQKQTQLAQIDASLAILARENENTIVTAPFDGLITECPATAGGTLPMNALAVEIQNRNALYLSTDLLTEDAALLTEGTTVTAINLDYGLTLEGLAISAISPKATDTTSSLGVEQKRIPVEIALPSMDIDVPFESDWDATFIITVIDDALWLPKSAVYSKNGISYVCLADGKTEQPVSIGIRQEDRVQITEGLALGDKVLLSH